MSTAPLRHAMPADTHAAPMAIDALPARTEGAAGKVSHASSYREILRSSAAVGGSALANVGIGMVRTKLMAVLLGPAGFGLMGMYTSIADLTRSVAEMGINSSGVRQIAESVASGDAARIGRTVTVLRRTAIVLGAIGALLLVIGAWPISWLSFGNGDHAGAVALLSLAVFLRLISDGQCALLQGMRRIPDLARIGVLGSLGGAVAGVVLVYAWRMDGVVPALIAVAGATAATSWWYSRRVPIQRCPLDATQVRHEATALLKTGSAFMASGLLMMGAAYVVRLIVLRGAGLQAAGFYQAAWTIGGLYVGFVLQAMGADFYPRLVGTIGDATQSNRLVNEQMQVSLLLAGPGVIATLTLASLVIALLYSHEFAASIDVLRWIALGMALRVITWPMGYIVVARNLRLLFFASELAWTLVNVALSWWCIDAYGLDGAGIAFFGSYVFHGVLMYALSRRLTGFAFSGANRITGLLYCGSIGTVFMAFQTMPSNWAIAWGGLLTVAASVHSARSLYSMAGFTDVPAPLRKIFNKLGCDK